MVVISPLISNSSLARFTSDSGVSSTLGPTALATDEAGDTVDAGIAADVDEGLGGGGGGRGGGGGDGGEEGGFPRQG